MSFSEETVEKITKACVGTNIVEAAKYHIKPLNGLDILVCGSCLRVFHLLADLQKHKTKVCRAPPSDPSKFNPTSEVWAFMLWKTSPNSKGRKIKIADNAAMWNVWTGLPKEVRRAWRVAGNILFDMNSIHKSEDMGDKKEQFEALFPEHLASFQIEDEDESDDDQKDPNIVMKRITAAERPMPKKRKLGRVLDSSNCTFHSVVDKKLDAKTKKPLYRIRWGAEPDDFFTWELSENLDKWRDAITDFDVKNEAPIRPSRSSKAKALDRVKQWTKKSKFGDDENTPDTRSDEEEELSFDGSDDDDFMPEDPLGSVGDPNESSDSVAEIASVDLEEEHAPKRGRKRKESPKKGVKRAKISITPSSKTDDKIFHLCNCQGSVRVSSKSVPKLKSGVFRANATSSLVMLGPLMNKSKIVNDDDQPGLVIITNDIYKNRPGVRRRQGFKIQEEVPPPSPVASAPAKPLVKSEPPKVDAIKLLDIKKRSAVKPRKANKITIPAQTINTKISSPAETKKSALSMLMSNSLPSTPVAAASKPSASADKKSGLHTSPQHVVMPQGVDPGAVEVPPGMQLMVSDTGEYYLLPQQPEGSTVALAQDPESGTIQVVAIPEQNQAGQPIIAEALVPATTQVQTSQAVPIDGSLLSTGISEQSSGLMLVMSQTGELILVTPDQLQNGGAVQIAE